DFSHYEAMTEEQMEAVEFEVNSKIQENIPLLEERDVPIEDAQERGAMMLFGEKYGDFVRMITFDENYSVELCGGTHVGATGEIGFFRLFNESSVAAGVRRIEAIVGRPAIKLLNEEKKLIQKFRKAIGQSDDPVLSLTKLQEEKKALEKELDKINRQNSGAKLDTLLESGETLEIGLNLVKGEIPGADMNTLKQLGYDALQKARANTVIVLGSKNDSDGKVFLMVAVTEDLIKEKGLKAGALVGQLGRLVGGGGGGQPNLATAGGRNPEKLDEALNMAGKIIAESVAL
ncbi:MAG: DHHA1 domain-containing protein, partial [Balneolales bacterium]|nr:DHHA1 domain-containing protein [Balneolales bacterium]